jgi:tetratricopeptide (TPR) repeat protein
VAIDPQFAVAYFALGLVKDRDERFWRDLRRRGGDTAVAAERTRRRAWTRKAFLVDPFVDVRLMGAVNRNREYGSYFGMALNAFVEGNYQGAYRLTEMVIDYLRRGVASRDSLPPFLLWMNALAAARANYYREAISGLETLVQLDQAREADSMRAVPLNTNEYRYMLAALHQRLRHNTLAIRAYEQVLANDIGNYMVHVQLARIYEAERSWFDAVRERRLAVEVNPEDHSLLYDLGATLAAASRWQEAEEPLLRAAAMEPRHPGTQRVLGIVQQEVGKKGEARRTLARFLAIAPSRDSTVIADARRRLETLGPETSP